MNQPITQQQLKDLIKYNSATGAMTWKKSLSNRIKPGGKAGCIENRKDGRASYWYIKIHGTKYQAARLAVLYKTGQMPVGVVRYKDGNTLNLAWSNLIYTVPKTAKEEFNEVCDKVIADITAQHPGLRIRSEQEDRIKYSGMTAEEIYNDARKEADELWAAAKDARIRNEQTTIAPTQPSLLSWFKSLIWR